MNCISTEFTPRKHGGEKGVPFRIQVDSFTSNDLGEYVEHVHSCSCQVKVFKVRHVCLRAVSQNSEPSNSEPANSELANLVLANSEPANSNVFKPKGADRKLKTDREKMEKKSPLDQEKYQLSHETTLLKEVTGSERI